MTDKPIEEIKVNYDTFAELDMVAYELYGEEFYLRPCNITVEYVRGDEPRFFRTGRLEKFDDENCSYDVYQKRYEIFRNKVSEANNDSFLMLEGKTLFEKYEAISNWQLQVEQSCREFQAFLTFDQKASAAKIVYMNEAFIVGDNKITTQKVVCEDFFMTCNENKKPADDSPRMTVLKFSPEGFEPKYAVLVDISFGRRKILNMIKNRIKNDEKLKDPQQKTEDQKSGSLTPQHKQPDHFGAKPDYLNKDWLLGAADGAKSLFTGSSFCGG